MTSSGIRRSLFAVCVVLCSSAAHAQSAASRIWTTVGSAGTIDEADVSAVFFEQGKVQMGRPQPGSSTTGGSAAAPTPAASAAAPGSTAAVLSQTRSAVIRYNVTPVDGLYASGLTVELKLRFLDTGSDAQVIAKLIEVDLATGSETPRITFDSNMFGAANVYRVTRQQDCAFGRFDFIKKAYYIEATLTGNSIFIGSAAGIHVIKVRHGNCDASETS